MAKLSTAERAKLPAKVFGLPGKAPGSGSYPMPDQKHASLAVGFAKRNATPADQKKITAKAHRMFPGMNKPADPSKLCSLSSMQN